MFLDTVLSGSFTTPATGNANQVLKLPFVPDLFEIWVQGNASGDNWIAATGAVKYAFWQQVMVSGTALAETNNPLVPLFLATGGITPVTSFANLYGPAISGTGITAASPAVLTLTNTVANTAPIPTGSWALLESTTGALQLSGIPWFLTVVTVSAGTTTYNIGDSFSSASFMAGASGVIAKQVLYPAVFFPYVSYIVGMTLGSTTTVVTSTPNGLSVGDTIRLVVPSIWGPSQISGQQGMVFSITDPYTFVVNINSSAATAFAFPNSAQAAAGITFAQVVPFGDQASAFDLSAVDNNYQGLIIGNSATAGSAILSENNALCLWRAQKSARIYTTLTF